MTLRRAILELGAGTDLHGQDYTKAAVRGVRDALQHSSLTFLRTMEIDPEAMHVDVTVGAQRPERVDAHAVRDAFPHGQVTVRAVPGGLDVPDEEGRAGAVIATVAIAVRVDLP